MTSSTGADTQTDGGTGRPDEATGQADRAPAATGGPATGGPATAERADATVDGARAAADRPAVRSGTITAGARFADIAGWENHRDAGPHIWRTLGYRRVGWEPGGSSVEWDAPVDYCFPTATGPIVQGGLVTALLDAAMGGACWTVLNRDEIFLTADLRVEFIRPSTPGVLRADGRVVRRTRRVVFCSADLVDADGLLLATSRCTQIVMPADGLAGRHGPPEVDGGPPRDARG
jgi:uncharacterized protein (TIGR00369 family)